MNWTFDDIVRLEPKAYVSLTIEGGVNTWLKRFAAERNISRSHAVRGLITEAVRFWKKTRQPLQRRQEYPWAEFTARGMKAREISILLDPPILAGLHDISDITGKTSSRIVSEILLDAMNAQAELAAQGRLKTA